MCSCLSLFISTCPFLYSCLLPDSKNKLKTQVVTHSLDPTWNEDLVLAGVPIHDLKENRIVELTVWDYDSNSWNSFLGGVRLGLFSTFQGEWMDSIGEEVGPKSLKCDCAFFVSAVIIVFTDI